MVGVIAAAGLLAGVFPSGFKVAEAPLLVLLLKAPAVVAAQVLRLPCVVGIDRRAGLGLVGGRNGVDVFLLVMRHG
jgi:hypothetical protein